MMKNEIDKIKLNFLKRTIHNPLFMDVTVQSQNQVSVSLASYLYFDHVIWGQDPPTLCIDLQFCKMAS